MCIRDSLDKWQYATDPSSARNALSYGVKFTKIGPVDPEILDQIGPFFGRVVSPLFPQTIHNKLAD